MCRTYILTDQAPPEDPAPLADTLKYAPAQRRKSLTRHRWRGSLGLLIRKSLTRRRRVTGPGKPRQRTSACTTCLAVGIIPSIRDEPSDSGQKNIMRLVRDLGR